MPTTLLLRAQRDCAVRWDERVICIKWPFPELLLVLPERLWIDLHQSTQGRTMFVYLAASKRSFYHGFA